MKQLTCEMCGSTNLLKKDGVFICQDCGTKYSVEEAKKMMVEGTVDVSGSTVKVDTSAELDNLYQIARRAKADNNGENAAKYYDMILVKDPTSWEAAFYVVYFKAMECKIAQIQSAAISVSNCEDSVLELIKNHVSEDEQEAAVKEVMLRSQVIANMLANGAKSHYDGIDSDIRSNYTQEYVNNACAARDIMYICGTQIDRIFIDTPEIAKYAAAAWKAGIEIHTNLLYYFANPQANKQAIASYVEKIGKYDPQFSAKYFSKEKKENLNSKKRSLELEISRLETTIEKTPTGPKWKVFGIVLAVAGIIFILYGASGAGLGDGLLLGVPLVGVGIWIAIPKKKTTERNRATVESAKESLKEKQNELTALIEEINAEN